MDAANEHRAGEERPVEAARPGRPGQPAGRWSINGWPATVAVWTAEEWARSTDRPADAQLMPNGVRCALRML